MPKSAELLSSRSTSDEKDGNSSEEPKSMSENVDKNADAAKELVDNSEDVKKVPDQQQVHNLKLNELSQKFRLL